LLERRREREESLKVQEKNRLKSELAIIHPNDYGEKMEPISMDGRKRCDAPGVRKSDNSNLESQRPDAPENKMLMVGKSTVTDSIDLKNHKLKNSDYGSTSQPTRDGSCQEQNIPAATSTSSVARRKRTNELLTENELRHSTIQRDVSSSDHEYSLDSTGLQGLGRTTGEHFSRHELDSRVDTANSVKGLPMTRLIDVSNKKNGKPPIGGSDNADSQLVPLEVVTTGRMNARCLHNRHCRRDFVATLKDHNTSEDNPFLRSCQDSSSCNNSQKKIHRFVPNGDVFRLEKVTDYELVDPYGEKGRYSGLLIRGMPDGQGLMHYEDGRTYTGEWKRGRWHGKGKTVFINGDIYTGDYEMDKRSGVGTYKWSDGRVYDGEFRDDQREGIGVYSWPDGSVYKGSFRAGLRHGNGSYRFSDGSMYTGEFKEGKHHGFGEFIWKDGRCYRGEWVDGFAEGHGIEIRVDGTIRHDGEWKRDRPIRIRSKAADTAIEERARQPRVNHIKTDHCPSMHEVASPDNTECAAYNGSRIRT
jgi:hypothetical protein